jgi:hypothetical protein
VRQTSEGWPPGVAINVTQFGVVRGLALRPLPPVNGKAHDYLVSARATAMQGKIVQGQSWSQTGLVRCNRPGSDKALW